MDNVNTAIKDKREYSGLNLKEFEPITKINLRGKKRESSLQKLDKYSLLFCQWKVIRLRVTRN